MCSIVYITFFHLKDIVYQILFIHSIGSSDFYPHIIILMYIVYILCDIVLCNVFYRGPYVRLALVCYPRKIKTVLFLLPLALIGA